MVIESSWYERVSSGCIYRYTFKSDSFQLYDANAGYYVSANEVVPVKVERIDDLLQAILREGIELRITPSLAPLKELILRSTVNYSMIRMRNASEI